MFGHLLVLAGTKTFVRNTTLLRMSAEYGGKNQLRLWIHSPPLKAARVGGDAMSNLFSSPQVEEEAVMKEVPSSMTPLPPTEDRVYTALLEKKVTAGHQLWQTREVAILLCAYTND